MRELWAELGASMRILRTSEGMSLRQVEAESSVGRGTLSQVENGKARPNRDIVEWYDTALHGDGVLLALYAEARGAHGRATPIRDDQRHIAPGDEMTVSDPTVPCGQLVDPGAQVTASWKIHNTGTVPWRERRMRRIGAHGAVRLIVSEPHEPVADLDPGGSATMDITVTVPTHAGTYVAYWHMVDNSGRPCQAASSLLSVALVVVVA